MTSDRRAATRSRHPSNQRACFGNSLEWATTCPPPRHKFTAIPKIRSERPASNLHYPRAEPALPEAPQYN
jgi:heme/copper-type cytochrome/quinol oxidase subunit 1